MTSQFTWGETFSWLFYSFRYSYNPDYASYSGLKRQQKDMKITDTGVIAQEIQKILPDAIKEGETITLPNGEKIENFLLVNKVKMVQMSVLEEGPKFKHFVFLFRIVSTWRTSEPFRNCAK